MKRKTAIVGIVLVILFILVAIFAPFLAPHHYRDQNRRNILEGPSLQFPLGTDRTGRCVLSRIIYGSRISIMVGLVAVGIGMFIGVILGSIAGYVRGWVDYIILGLIDITWSFPTMLLGIALTAILRPGLRSVIIALGLVTWPQYARVIRGQFLSLREKEFVEAARALGVKDLGIMWNHILPNAIAPVIVVATMGMATAILVEATFSYLGLGAQPPEPSWGAILSAGKDFMYLQPWMSIAPGIAIMLLVFGFNLLGDAIRDAFDPRLKE